MFQNRYSEIENEVKLVIWDLDETFWRGTLSEGGIRPVPAHVQMVRSLVQRGIMCSICSKNDPEPVWRELEALGIRDRFVFAHIGWSPKGEAVAAIIRRMGMRPENVVFLDDNVLNREEVRYFSPGIACVDASDVSDGQDLSGLLNLPQMAGKDDRKWTRLAQYQLIEAREADQQMRGLSNDAFLRQSGIRLRLVTDLSEHMDRVIELINRSNQLNFTKRRIVGDTGRAELANLLRVPGVHAGLVEVRDRYGDYGFVGFFCIRKRYNGTSVEHFAFSCRTLNMGVEQWVWRHVGAPQFPIAGPVANGLDLPAAPDWITLCQDFDDDAADVVPDREVVLIGGCDLQQVSFYCGTRRSEFVNTQDDAGVIVRFDDAGFLLNPRDPELAHHPVFQAVAGYGRDDLLAVDESLGRAQVIILSMFFAFHTRNLFTIEGCGQPDRYLVTIPPKRLAALTRDPRMSVRMLRHLHHLRLPAERRATLLRSAFERIAGMRREGCRIFVLGASRRGELAERTLPDRMVYNTMCRDFCATHADAAFLDLDEIIPAAECVDSDHYTREGYFRIAAQINAPGTAMPDLRAAG
ncbi:HAD family hydrolase [Paracoccus ravus]|uniref:HAD family hydrolase n=1 Tax=Paracoccus ravus TaxID=2447760 RepID=UPI00106E6328|nr:HAD family hydrolase [Paracoccus ravus]